MDATAEKHHAPVPLDSSVLEASSLRIACLIPSATTICVALHLSKYIVGVTHECSDCLPQSRILTVSSIDNALPQSDIHQQVMYQASCSISSDVMDVPPSLYTIVPDMFRLAAPTVVITQDLCGVCAPTTSDVRKFLVVAADADDSIATGTAPTIVVSLAPNNLLNVLDSFVTVASACGVPDSGIALKLRCEQNLYDITRAVLENRDPALAVPRAVLLEWLDPPFDGGHWIPDMIAAAGCELALAVPPTVDTNTTASSKSKKSTQITWKQVQNSHASVVWIACCGRNLQENVADVVQQQQNDAVRAALECSTTALFCADGNAHFASPGPNLVTGVAVMAITAYQSQPAVVKAIQALFPCLKTDASEYFLPVPWPDKQRQSSEKTQESMIPDIEDDFDRLHQSACAHGDFTYSDPATGYIVFTELAHQKRGRCCGSGCRHCPYHHENINSPALKAAKIQQPALLYTGDDDDETAVFCSLKQAKHLQILFFSGGKDSFLTIRALVRRQQQRRREDASSYALVLLTTFDASTRIIAHQEVGIDVILRQAQHLGLPLVGVPLHRASSRTYVARIEKALSVVQMYLEQHNKNAGCIRALVFGDLHLDHIRNWRQDQMGKLGYEMLYPLWKMDYDALALDLDASKVPCTISCSTVERVQVGQRYNGDFRQFLLQSERDEEARVDLFGENGEFHTLAKVWEVDRSQAMGWNADSI
jgi:diphthamide synthase (EF-2-diphthine--ammonia ligase)